MATTLFTEFIQHSILRLQENTPRIATCLAELSEEEVWQRPNPSSNSIGNLILHLCGNITQYIHSSLGGKEDLRERDLEFAADSGWPKQQLLDLLEKTVGEAVSVILHLKEEEALILRSVQGYSMSAVGIVVHVTEHYSYHTGQIAYWTKVLKNKDLGFYANLNLNVKNK